MRDAAEAAWIGQDVHAAVALSDGPKQENPAAEAGRELTSEDATALRGHFIASLWSSEVHRAQFHHNNGEEGRRDKRGLSLVP